jgi:protein phosphatase
MEYAYTSLSEIGLKRKDNEDSIGVFEILGGTLFIVCDGLGGNKAGEVASQITVETILETFQNSTIDDFLERIRYSIIKAHEKVTETSETDFGLKGMATTAEVLFIKDDTAYWGHVGDSRIYLSRNGILKLLTKDHSLVQKLVDEGYLTLKEAENHPNKNIIMQALGDGNYIDVELSKVRITPQEFYRFLLCSDGVTAVIKNEELEKFLDDRVKNINQLAEEMKKLIVKRGAPDNYSFIIISKKEN